MNTAWNRGLSYFVENCQSYLIYVNEYAISCLSKWMPHKSLYITWNVYLQPKFFFQSFTTFHLLPTHNIYFSVIECSLGRFNHDQFGNQLSNNWMSFVIDIITDLTLIKHLQIRLLLCCVNDMLAFFHVIFQRELNWT